MSWYSARFILWTSIKRVTAKIFRDENKVFCEVNNVQGLVECNIYISQETRISTHPSTIFQCKSACDEQTHLLQGHYLLASEVFTECRGDYLYIVLIYRKMSRPSNKRLEQQSLWCGCVKCEMMYLQAVKPCHPGWSTSCWLVHSRNHIVSPRVVKPQLAAWTGRGSTR